ncbi:unnamed protein product [Camellia sinensis]
MTRTLISSTTATKSIKFLYSYGGKIHPRPTDGKLRYVGGLTRVLSVDRSITFSELMVKFGELCGSSMTLKCKLPNEDLDVLVTIASDEDLANVIDEYDRFSLSTQKDMKITAVLFPIKSLKKISPVSSVDDLCSSGSSLDSSATTTSPTYVSARFCSAPPYVATAPCRCGGRNSSNYSQAFRFPFAVQKESGEAMPMHHHHLYRCYERKSPRHVYGVPQWNHCRHTFELEYSGERPKQKRIFFEDSFFFLSFDLDKSAEISQEITFVAPPPLLNV